MCRWQKVYFSAGVILLDLFTISEQLLEMLVFYSVSCCAGFSQCWSDVCSPSRHHRHCLSLGNHQQCPPHRETGIVVQFSDRESSLRSCLYHIFVNLHKNSIYSFKTVLHNTLLLQNILLCKCTENFLGHFIRPFLSIITNANN